MELKYLACGDKCMMVEFSKIIDEKINNAVLRMSKQLEEKKPSGVIEVIPTFRSLMIYYDSKIIDFNTLKELVKGLDINDAKENEKEKRTLLVPCCYGARFGTDLYEVEKYTGLGRDEIINIHSMPEYKIYMLGFLPGFVYLGGMDERIAIPRMQNPRLKILPGSVGIGGNQTGVYPIQSPGGWRMIGATPIEFYNPLRQKPILCEAGEYIKFVPITIDEYYDIRRDILNENYFTEYVIEKADKTKRTEKIKNLCSQQKKKSDILIYEKSIKNTDNKDTNNEKDNNICICEIQGALTTIQDKGRIGFQKYGMSVSGAMDMQAYESANYLVGNENDEAVLEMTLYGGTYYFEKDAVIALTGADMQAMVNDEPIKRYKPIKIKAKDRISIKMAKQGCRGYMAVSGGFMADKVMGSFSTNLKCKIGGLSGEAIKSGSKIKTGTPSKTFEELEKRELAIPQYDEKIMIHVIEGPQEEYFTDKGIKSFYENEWIISAQSDRMGYRMEGGVIEAKNGTDIVSDGIANGSIQIPPNGKPIILLADRQTTGGYAKIATVCSFDLPKLAQAKAGDRVSFKKITVEKAQGYSPKSLKDREDFYAG